MCYECTLQNVAPADDTAFEATSDAPRPPPRGQSVKSVAFEDAACSTTTQPDPPTPPPKKNVVSEAKKMSPKRTKSSSSSNNVRTSKRDCEMLEKRLSIEIPATKLCN